MQVNSAQDYLTRVKRQVIAKASILAPPPQKRKNNTNVLSFVANSEDQYNRFIVPAAVPGGATFVSYCCSALANVLNLVVSSGAGTNAQTLSWNESFVTTRTVVVTYNGSVVSGAVSSLGAGTCVVTAQGADSGVYVVTVTISNINGSSASSSINLTIGYATITGLALAPSSLATTGSAGTLTWSESGSVTSRSVGVVRTGSITVTGAVSALVANSCTITAQSASTTYTITVTVTNALGSASQAITASIACFLGYVLVITRTGPVAMEDVTEDMELLQTNGSYSRVVSKKCSVLTDAIEVEHRRLFADPEEKMAVTFWHKVKIGDGEEMRAGDHPMLHEVFRPFPVSVYHVQLENPSDKVLVYDTSIVAESWSPPVAWIPDDKETTD